MEVCFFCELLNGFWLSLNEPMKQDHTVEKPAWNSVADGLEESQLQERAGYPERAERRRTQQSERD